MIVAVRPSNVIVPRLDPTSPHKLPSDDQHGSETENSHTAKRKLNTEAAAVERQSSPGSVLSAEASCQPSDCLISDDAESKPHRSKRRKDIDNARPPLNSNSSMGQEEDETIQHAQKNLFHILVAPKQEQKHTTLSQDAESNSISTEPSTVAPQHDIPQPPESEPVKHQATPPTSPSPPRKLIKLHINGKLLSSPALQPISPSTPGPIPEGNLENQLSVPEPANRRELRLTANGKLLSSPPPKVPEELVSDTTAGKKRVTRSKSTRRKKNKKTLLVKIKYGTDDTSRTQVGEIIEAIFSGEPQKPQTTVLKVTSNDPTEEQRPAAPRKPTPPPQPPKPTHPFFLPKSAQEPAVSAPSNPDKKPSAQNPPSPNPPVVKPPPVQLLKPLGSQTKPPAVTITRPWPSFRTKSPRYPDSKHPLWPFRNGVHVRGLDTDQEPKPVPHDFNVKNKKGKGKIYRVDDSENVLSLISKSLKEMRHDHENRAKSVMRYPRQQHWTGHELKKIVGNRLRTIHTAVLNSQEEIKNATTAFDRGSCEDNMWTVKYAPSSTEDVLQDNGNVTAISEWLRKLIVDTVKKEAILNSKSKKGSDKDKKKKKKKKKRKSELDGFITSDGSDGESENWQSMLEKMDDDEDELGLPITTIPRRMPIGPPKKAILVTGPTGCGKTASVYAAAKELGFEVFEVNAGSRRSGKDILERVGDMAQNHLVQLEKQLDGDAAVDGGPQISETTDAPESSAPDPTKQKTMASFFNITAPKQKTIKPEQPITQPRQVKAESKQQSLLPGQPQSNKQKQSLILLDDVDILFEEDKQFWSGVIALLEHSKRPVIMTCTNDSTVPISELELEDIVRMTSPPSDIVVDYCLTIAAKEGHLLRSEDVETLYMSMGKDLRATLTALNFWCQMGVGSEKAGLDWRPDSRLIFGNEEEKDEVSRTISEGDYVDGMEMFNHDMAALTPKLENAFELREEYLKQWSIGVMDWEEREMIDTMRQTNPTNDMDIGTELRDTHEWTADMRSCLDIFCGQSLETPFHDQLDTSWPEISAKQRSSYTETYPLVQADPQVEYASLTTKIGSTFSVLLHRHISQDEKSEEQILINHTKRRASNPIEAPMSRNDLYAILEPLSREDLTLYNAISGRQSFSLDREISVAAEDVAPYIRAIVSTDEEAMRRREEFLREEQENNPKRRKTRASMAATEGGTVSRRETYFTRHNDLVPAIFDTASVSWGKALESYMRDLPPVQEVPVFERDWKWIIETPADFQGL